MKEFNLEEAKAGKPVVTSEGYPVRIVCYDRRSAIDESSILALVNEGDYELCNYYSPNGIGIDGSKLFMTTGKVTLWTNVYSVFGGYHVGQTLLYSSKEVALENVVSKKNYTYIDTVKIEVEV